MGLHYYGVLALVIYLVDAMLGCRYSGTSLRALVDGSRGGLFTRTLAVLLSWLLFVVKLFS